MTYITSDLEYSRTFECDFVQLRLPVMIMFPKSLFIVIKAFELYYMNISDFVFREVISTEISA